jgi:probable HAF family extracellular repeat protein
MALSSGFAGTIEYSITDLGVLSTAGSSGGSHPTAMNNLGQVVGFADADGYYSHAFFYTGSGPLVDLGTLAGNQNVSVATGINDQSMIVGYTDTPGPGSPTHAFLYTQSAGLQDLGTLGGSSTSAVSGATAINNNSQIIGYSNTATGGVDGFIYSGNGPMVDLGAYLPQCINNAGLVGAVLLPGSQSTAYVSSGGTGAWMNIGTLGGTYTVPYAINGSGEIVGESATRTASKSGQPFIYSGGTMTDLGTFGGLYGEALAVNDYGVVVGSADLSGDESGAAFVYHDGGAIENLNDLVDPSLGWNIGGAVAVNDSGQITAEAYQQGGPDHGILLTPVPEPSSRSLMLAAIFPALAIACRRRKSSNP